MSKLELNGKYIINAIELDEGIFRQGTQIIECLAKSTTKYLLLFEESNDRIWLPFEREIQIMEEL